MNKGYKAEFQWESGHKVTRKLQHDEAGLLHKYVHWVDETEYSFFKLKDGYKNDDDAFIYVEFWPAHFPEIEYREK